MTETTASADAAARPAQDPDGPLTLWRVAQDELESVGYPVPTRLINEPKVPVASETPAECEARVLAALRRGLAEEARGEGLAALCISGGGIRSATLNLGAVQALARAGVLTRFHFLSTVSGGGYLGGWLSAWAKRQQGAGGMHEVSRRLNERGPGGRAEQPEIRHLREFSNYLAPRKGALSPDTWTIVATHARNLLLNWVVLFPMFAAALCVPRALVALFRLPRLGVGDPAVWRLALGTACIVLGGFAFGNAGRLLPSARARAARRAPRPDASGAILRAWRRLIDPPGTQGDFLLLCLAPVVLSALALAFYWRIPVPRSLPWSARAPWYFVPGLGVAGFGYVIFAWRAGWAERVWCFVASMAAGGATSGCLLGLSYVMRLVDRELRAVSATGVPGALHVAVNVPMILLSLSLGGTLYVGFTSRLSSATDDDREWWGRFGAWVLIVCVVWLAVCGVVLFLPAAFLVLGPVWKWALSAAGGTSGLVGVLLGRGASTPAGREQPAEPTLAQRLRSGALALTAPVFIAILFGAMSLGVTGAMAPFVPVWIDAWDWTTHFMVTARTDVQVVVASVLVLSGLTLILAECINSNRLSMHAMYRDRLIRAYLGASKAVRTPDLFTGFDPEDNLLMHQLVPEAIYPQELDDPDDLLDKLVDCADPNATPDVAALRTVRDALSPESRAALQRFRSAPSGTYPAWLRRTVIDEVNRFILSAPPAPPAGPAARLKALRHSLNTALGRTESPAARPITAPDARRGPAVRALIDRALREKPARERTDVAARRHAHQRAARAAGDGAHAIPSGAPTSPLHVINTALNLVRMTDAAWQDRKADSFTISALHCGAARLGYRRSVTYGGDRGISLGTAVTISGAAASPNMGSHSSPAVTFLLAFFNVRLGSWLGNPLDPTAWRRNAPRVGLVHLIAEFFGFTDDWHRYVYLSDGGHFENLGLYEMVRRRCRRIVVLDAGCDPSFSFDDLGNAVRKIRADLGVDVRFDGRVPITARDPELKQLGCRVAVARIDYSRMDDPAYTPGATKDEYVGTLVYIKSSFYGQEPVDVFNYACESKAFPHESTADQFFSESQFESYRRLGEQIISEVVARPVLQTPDPLDRFVEQARDTEEAYRRRTVQAAAD